MKVNLHDIDFNKIGEIELKEEVFSLDERPDILNRVVVWQLAKKQSGNHKVKTVSEVSGTTKKPFKQKGTGNARMGTLRATQCRGGGIVFGPTPRSHAHNLTKKFRKLGLKIALSAKQKSGKLLIVDNMALSGSKTSAMNKSLTKAKIDSALFIGNNDDANLKLSIRNIKNIDYLPEIGANVYDILNHDMLIISKEALDKLQGRL